MCLQSKRGKKVNIRATVSPYLSKKMNRLVENEDFGSVSDVISVAVTEFLVKYQNKEEVKV
jgi:hypothetical protein